MRKRCMAVCLDGDGGPGKRPSIVMSESSRSDGNCQERTRLTIDCLPNLVKRT